METVDTQNVSKPDLIQCDDMRLLPYGTIIGSKSRGLVLSCSFWIVHITAIPTSGCRPPWEDECDVISFVCLKL